MYLLDYAVVLSFSIKAQKYKTVRFCVIIRLNNCMSHVLLTPPGYTSALQVNFHLFFFLTNLKVQTRLLTTFTNN